ncbi:MAG: hypothetical protein HQ538_05190, partial [Parcubacteria group bacterium]|nr:hypothetical protein [Parcubacteria group bacterium]
MKKTIRIIVSRSFYLLIAGITILSLCGVINLNFLNQARAATWTTETADSSISVGSFPSVAIDSLGNIHVSYYDDTSDDLKYTTKSEGTWTTEIVDSTGTAGPFTSIVIDSSNNPHISYMNGSLKLGYATKSGSNWIIETVDNSAASGYYTSITLDSLDNPHISYSDGALSGLYYATKSGAAWFVESVDSNFGVGWYSSIALDSSNNPHISYYDWINTRLKYTTNSGSGWSNEIVDDSAIVGQYTSIALDSSNNPHISYLNGTDFSLQYITKLGTWSTSVTVDNSAAVGVYSSIALDSSDNPHIGYYDLINSSLKYANYSGSWSNENVDSVVQGPGFASDREISIAIDSQDEVHIVYRNDTTQSLKYATTSTTPPNPTLSIDSASSTTTDQEVDLTLSSYGDATYMIVGNESDLSDGTAVPFSSTTTHTLTSGDGTKTVYARVGNAQGASSIVSDTITLDTSTDTDDDSDDSDDSSTSTPSLSPKILTTSGPGQPTRLQAYSKATTDGTNSLFEEDITNLFPDSYLGGAGIVPIDYNNNGVLDQFLLFAIHEGGPQALLRAIKEDGSISSLGQHFVFQAPGDEPGTSSIRDGLSATSGDFDNDGFQDDAAFCLTGDYEPTVKVFTDVSGIDNWTLLNQFTIPDVGSTGCNLGTFQYDTGA